MESFSRTDAVVERRRGQASRWVTWKRDAVRRNSYASSLIKGNHLWVCLCVRGVSGGIPGIADTLADEHANSCTNRWKAEYIRSAQWTPSLGSNHAHKHICAQTPIHTRCCFETLAPVYIPSGPTGSSISNPTLAGHMLVLKCPLLGPPAWPSSSTHTHTNTSYLYGLKAVFEVTVRVPATAKPAPSTPEPFPAHTECYEWVHVSQCN